MREVELVYTFIMFHKMKPRTSVAHERISACFPRVTSYFLAYPRISARFPLVRRHINSDLIGVTAVEA